jgi:hypothetical protein
VEGEGRVSEGGFSTECVRVGDSAGSVAPGSGEEPREITSVAAIASVTRQHRRGSDLNPSLDRLYCVVLCCVVLCCVVLCY